MSFLLFITELKKPQDTAIPDFLQKDKVEIVHKVHRGLSIYESASVGDGNPHESSYQDFTIMA